jgi:HEAT repeat protein
VAARKKLEQEVQALSALRDRPLDADAHAQLARALDSRSSAVVAVAANVISHAAAAQYVPALGTAFDRFMLRATETDKGCLAKTAIARALLATSADCDALWLRAIRHVQLEPIWGGRQDTAVELRGIAAAALVQSDYPDVMVELTRLLADGEVMARVGAAQALGATRHVGAATPLLRFKVLSGDPDSRVIAACLSSLLGAAPEASLSFVAERLDAADPVLREAAAIALGESRLPGAFEPLAAAAERAATESDRRAALLGIALLRSERGHAHLLGLVAEAPHAVARLALEALAVFRHDATLRARVMQVAVNRAALTALARESFPG